MELRGFMPVNIVQICERLTKRQPGDRQAVIGVPFGGHGHSRVSREDDDAERVQGVRRPAHVIYPADL